MDKPNRPIYLNLPQLAAKMSVTAKISILHRVSGVLMFLAIPFVLRLFHESLTNPKFYANSYTIATLPLMKIVYIVLIWAVMHHMCAGVRFLFLDIHAGIERVTAQRTAKLVLVISILLTIFLGILIW